MNSWSSRIRAGALVLTLAAIPLGGFLAAPTVAVAGPHENGWLGVTLQSLDPDLREALGIDRRVRGVLVNSVKEGSPAGEAGIRIHDVIVSVDGHRTDSVDEAVRVVRAAGADREVPVVVNRKGTERGLSARLRASGNNFVTRGDDAPGHHGRRGNVFFHDGDEGDAPRVFTWKSDDDKDGDSPNDFTWESDDDKDGEKRIIVFHGDDGQRKVLRFGDDGEHADRMHEHIRKGIVDDKRRDRARGGFLGVETMELNEQLAEHFGVKKDHGVLITRVVEESPAREVGLKAGDVILSINGDRVRDADHLRRIVRAAGEDSECQVQVMRDGKERAFKVRLGNSGDFGAGWTPRGDLHIDLPGLRDIHEGHRLHGGDGVFELDLEGLHGLEGLEGLEDLPLKLDLLRDNLDGLRIQINGHDWDEEDMHEALEKAQHALEKARRKLEQNLKDDDN